MHRSSEQPGIRQLVKEDLEKIWHPFTSLVGAPLPIAIESGKGAHLHTMDGRTIIDGISSWWVNLHGHAHPLISSAIAEQSRKLEQVIFAGFTHEPAIKLSQNLLSILPESQSRIFFSDDGSTAVEVGLKMAIQYWHNQGVKKTKLIALDGAYHGDTFGSMSVGSRGAFTLPFSDLLFDVDFVPFPAPGNEQATVNEFNKLSASGEVAAFIFEPLVQGSAGMRMYQPAVLDKLVKISHDNDVLCIADEVMTGFGRTGKLFASDYLDHKPDIFCLSKGLTGGYLPMGVTTCSLAVERAFQSADVEATFFHGHSYTANPIACAAANASFDLLVNSPTLNNINRITNHHLEFMKKISNRKKIRDLRSMGTILALELETGSATSYFDRARSRIYEFFLDRGILLRPLGNVIYIMPPYVINDADLKKIYLAIEDFQGEF